MLVSAPPPLVASMSSLGAGVQHAPIAFDLVGATWSGPDSIHAEVRARGTRGWTRWVVLTRDQPGESEPVWVGRSRLLQVRFRGHPRRVRLRLVRSEAEPRSPLRALAEEVHRRSSRGRRGERTSRSAGAIRCLRATCVSR